MYGSAKTHNCLRRYSLKSVKLIHFKTKEDVSNTHTAILLHPDDEKMPLDSSFSHKAIPDFKPTQDQSSEEIDENA